MLASPSRAVVLAIYFLLTTFPLWVVFVVCFVEGVRSGESRDRVPGGVRGHSRVRNRARVDR